MKEYLKIYIPSYLRESAQLRTAVILAALFSLAFLVVVIPFSPDSWFRLGNSIFFGYTALFAGVCLTVLSLSKMTMHLTRNLFPMTYWQYILWNLAEVVVIALLYTVFTVNIAAPENMGFWAIFARALVIAFVCIGVPYIIAAMFYTIDDQMRTIRLMRMGDVVSDDAPPKGEQPDRFTLFDNNGALKLSVSSANLYYVESDDNYIKVWYLDNHGELKTYMLRCRMKTVEESFAGSSLMRCHRKFIVNMDHVKVLEKTPSGYELTLDNDAIDPIPVTKTYAPNILERVRGAESAGAL